MDKTENITISLAEYTRLVKCQAILHMVVNFTGYDKGTIVDTVTEMFENLDGGPANE